METNTVYNLSWGEYGTSLSSTVQLLRCHGELVDVTLAASGRSFHAHKIVLCAASPFLFDLLKSTPCKHPIVMLAGVEADDLELILEFVYRGEVSIEQHQISSLLQAARCLDIQALASVLSDVIKSSQCKEGDEANLDTSEIAQNQLTRFKESHEKVADQGLEVNININGLTPVWVQQMQANDVTPVIDSSQVTKVAGLKVKGASDQPGVCPLCGALLRQARNLRRHLATSCKYRMLNGVTSSNRQAQTLQIQSVEEAGHHYKSETITVLPISCSEIITSNSNVT